VPTRVPPAAPSFLGRYPIGVLPLKAFQSGPPSTADTAGPNAIDNYDPDFIDGTGAFTVDEFLHKLPPSQPGATRLVLIDGVPTKLDLNSLPMDKCGTVGWPIGNRNARRVWVANWPPTPALPRSTKVDSALPLNESKEGGRGEERATKPIRKTVNCVLNVAVNATRNYPSQAGKMRREKYASSGWGTRPCRRIANRFSLRSIRRTVSFSLRAADM